MIKIEGYCYSYACNYCKFSDYVKSIEFLFSREDNIDDFLSSYDKVKQLLELVDCVMEDS